jgi:hypothetical protein
VEAELKDDGDQALMRGLATAFPIVRPGAIAILLRASVGTGHKAVDRYGGQLNVSLEHIRTYDHCWYGWDGMDNQSVAYDVCCSKYNSHHLRTVR